MFTKLKPPACLYPCSYKHGMWLTMCALVCAHSVYTEQIKKYNQSAGDMAEMSEVVVKYRVDWVRMFKGGL